MLRAKGEKEEVTGRGKQGERESLEGVIISGCDERWEK